MTSRKGKRWVLPKGVVEPELAPAVSAEKEALEEAGVRGAIDDRPLGTYQYRKWGGTCTVQVHTMAVTAVLDEWEESYRDREWVSLDEAVARVEEDDLKRILQSLPEFRRSP